MKFTETRIAGVWVIEPDRHTDTRGDFFRSWCRDEFAERGLAVAFSQISASINVRAGTLRGLHYQAAPCEEAKLIRCVRGAAYDVAVDLRQGSPTYAQWIATEITAANGLMVYLAEGIAHGFQATEPDTELVYHITVPYVAALARGVRWNDPTLAIEWPIAEPILSPRDASLPLLSRATRNVA